MRDDTAPKPITNIRDTSAFKDKIKLASPEYNKGIWEIVDRSKPNDFIRLTHPEMEKLESLWTRFLPPGSDIGDKMTVPSDLLLAGTIPLTDVVMELDMDNNGKMYRFRIVIFEDYKEIIQDYMDGDSEDAVIVGVCIRQFTEPGTGNEIGFPITVFKDGDYINNVEMMYYRNIPNGYKQDAIPVVLGFLLQSGALGIWYGIQLALLNPVTKEAFVRAGKEKYKDSVCVGNGAIYRKGATRYIKRMKLHEGNFDTLLHSTGKSYTRHTLAWRVIGHWRHYQNGKSVFIKPYWKGLMKNIQKQDCRERKLVIPEEGKENDRSD